MGGTEHAELGFGLVCFAGAATGLGAAIVFSKRLVSLASKRFLAGALGVSAGVMLYVSFVEILVKSMDAFNDAGESEGMAYFYATLCFFCGVLANAILDRVVHWLEAMDSPFAPKGGSHVLAKLPGDEAEHGGDSQHVDMSYVDMKMVKGLNEEGAAAAEPANTSFNIEAGAEAALEAGKGHVEETKEGELAVGTDQKLKRMGMLTALAIGLHNFPEGLATFVATLDDPSVGAGLAIAIAIHNVPEGICVSVPIYYATGNRTRAFLWALLSGVSEPIGAGLGWLVLANTFDDRIYGTLFGIVGGIMVHIVLHELIPTALRYDPEDKVVTHSVFIGCAIMALSLVLFQVA